jgi:hypothetical protein
MVRNVLDEDRDLLFKNLLSKLNYNLKKKNFTLEEFFMSDNEYLKHYFVLDFKTLYYQAKEKYKDMTRGEISYRAYVRPRRYLASAHMMGLVKIPGGIDYADVPYFKSQNFEIYPEKILDEFKLKMMNLYASKKGVDKDLATLRNYLISKNGMGMDRETAQWYVDGIKNSMRGNLLKGRKLDLNNVEKN